MSSRRERRAIQTADLAMNMTPMIDVVFLLIIFFMVATSLSKEENDASIRLPEADSARDDLRSPTTVVVNVRQDGYVRVGDKLYVVRELPLVFRQLAQTHPDRVVVVRADGRTTHQYFIRTLEACARAGLLNVRVAAKRVRRSK